MAGAVGVWDVGELALVRVVGVAVVELPSVAGVVDFDVTIKGGLAGCVMLLLLSAR